MSLPAKSLFVQGLLLCLALAPARANTVTDTSANTAIGTAQPVTLFDSYIVHQAPPNFSLLTAQPVSPSKVADGLGSIAAGGPGQFFSVALTAGQTLNMQVGSTSPAGQLTELQLFDPNGNLVAIASGNGSDAVSSVITFTVPSTGNWYAEVLSPSSAKLNYDLAFSSPGGYTADVLGALTNPNNPGFYAIGANVGDNLALSAFSTSPLHTPNELLLFDANGNLVAIAAGNASDGAGSVIDFTIPSGDAGTWVAEVAGSPNVANPNADLFRYDLNIQGATGLGPVNPNPPSPTPEPAFYGLLGASLAGLGLFRRLETKRRQRSPAGR